MQQSIEVINRWTAHVKRPFWRAASKVSRRDSPLKSESPTALAPPPEQPSYRKVASCPPLLFLHSLQIHLLNPFSLSVPPSSLFRHPPPPPPRERKDHGLKQGIILGQNVPNLSFAVRRLVFTLVQRFTYSTRSPQFLFCGQQLLLCVQYSISGFPWPPAPLSY